MTIEQYGRITDELENKINNVKYLKDQKGNLIRTWLENETFKAIKMYEHQEKLTSYEFIKKPIEKLTITDTEIIGTKYSREYTDLTFINDEDFEQNAITQLAIKLYNDIKNNQSHIPIKISLNG